MAALCWRIESTIKPATTTKSVWGDDGPDALDTEADENAALLVVFGGRVFVRLMAGVGGIVVWTISSSCKSSVGNGILKENN